MRTLLFILLSVNVILAEAQGIINNGAKLIIGTGSSMQINGENGNYISQYAFSNNPIIILNGTFNLGGNWNNNTLVPINLTNSNGTIEFNGNSLQSINGTLGTYFKNISINNFSGVYLNSNISVINQIEMKRGNLDLRNYSINLGTSGEIINETEKSRINATDGFTEGGGSGSVYVVKQIIPGINNNLAGLGLSIYTLNNIGKITIERKHNIIKYNGMESVSRYFILSANNDTPINATIRMNYFEKELNGQSEEELVFWNSEDNGTSWKMEYPTAKDIESNYIEKTGIINLNRWSIGAPFAGGFLPIELLSFDGTCENEQMTIRWSTASESNNDFFTLERADDAINFVPIALVKGAGNSNSTINYQFIDKNPSAENYYRLKQTDFDGKFKYFPVKSFDCEKSINNEAFVNCYPNPCQEKVNFKFNHLTENGLQIKVADVYGRILVNKQISDLKDPSFEFTIDMSNFKSGAYYYVITSGSFTKSGEIIKN